MSNISTQYPPRHPTSMFFVAIREVILVVQTTRRTRSVKHTQSRTDAPHSLLFGVMDAHEVKTCIDTVFIVKRGKGSMPP